VLIISWFYGIYATVSITLLEGYTMEYKLKTVVATGLELSACIVTCGIGITRLESPKRREKKASILFRGEVFRVRKNFSRDKFEGGVVLRKKLGTSSVRVRNSRIVSSKLTVHLRLYTSKLVIDPEEKRAEYIARIEGQIKRLEKMINSNRTKSTVKLRAMQTLAELIKTSYTMVRDEEIEKTERETQTLEEEAKRPAAADSAEEESTNPT
jgi:ribosome-associated translation inhibitor RaiA